MVTERGITQGNLSNRTEVNQISDGVRQRTADDDAADEADLLDDERPRDVTADMARNDLEGDELGERITGEPLPPADDETGH